MNKTSAPLRRHASFSYAAAEPDPKNPGPLLELVNAALDRASQNPEAAPICLYCKLDPEGRPFLTTNPNTKQQRWTERNSDQFAKQRLAANTQAFKLGQFWFNNSRACDDAKNAARALFELSTNEVVKADGLDCTRQLQGLLKILNEAYQAGEADPPPPSTHTTRASLFRLPPLSPRKPGATSVQPPRSPRLKKPLPSVPITMTREPTVPTIDLGAAKPGDAASSQSSLSSEQEDSSTRRKRSPTKAIRLEKRVPVQNLKAERERIQSLNELYNLYYAESDPPKPALPAQPSSGLPVAPEPLEHPAPHTPASDRPKPSPEVQQAHDDTPSRARSASTIPGRQGLSQQPKPRPSIYLKQKPETPPVSPTTGRLLPSAPADQTPPTEKH